MEKDLKYKYFFWALVVVLLVFFGIEIVISQFSIASQGNVWHDASEIVCDECISKQNMGSGSVDNRAVSNGAGIFSRKINGANGYVFYVDLPNPGTFQDIEATNSSTIGMVNWGNSYMEIMCDGSDNGITALGGLSLDGIYRKNHRIIKIDSQDKIVYEAKNTGGNILQTLTVGYNGDKLKFKRTYTAPSGSLESEITKFDCHLKILSLCPGGPGDRSTCNY